MRCNEKARELLVKGGYDRERDVMTAPVKTARSERLINGIRQSTYRG
jgi:hypothetical protein